MILHSSHLQALLQTVLLKTFNLLCDYLDRNSLQYAELFNVHVDTSKAVDFQIHAKVMLPNYVCMCVCVCVCVCLYSAQLRMMGVNPLQMERVTFSDKIGVNYSTLVSMLNPTFDLADALGSALNETNVDVSQVLILQYTASLLQCHVSCFMCYINHEC